MSAGCEPFLRVRAVVGCRSCTVQDISPESTRSQMFLSRLSFVCMSVHGCACVCICLCAYVCLCVCLCAHLVVKQERR